MSSARSRLVAFAAVVAVIAAALSGPAAAVVPPLESAPASGPYIDPVHDVALTADGVVYGRSVNIDGVAQDLVLNVYEPVGSDDLFRPVIVWAAGGGFVHNRGRDRTYWMPEMVRRGYVVVSIEYRIRPDMPYGFDGIVSEGPAAVIEAQEAARDGQHDMQAAVRWVRANAAALRIDSTRVVAAGYSAGAIMSLLTAYNSDDPGTSGNDGWASHVAAAVSGAGGYLPGGQGTIDPGEAPVLMFHGTHDTTVPIAGALAPCAAAVAVTNVCESHLYPGQQHNVGDVLPDEMTRHTVDFLYRHVIAVERVETAFRDLAVQSQGQHITLSGRLVQDGDTPVRDAPLQARNRDGSWTQATTALDGSFAVTVGGPQPDVLLRYDGSSSGSRLDGPPLAPTSATVDTR